MGAIKNNIRKKLYQKDVEFDSLISILNNLYSAVRRAKN